MSAADLLPTGKQAILLMFAIGTIAAKSVPCSKSQVQSGVFCSKTSDERFLVESAPEPHGRGLKG